MASYIIQDTTLTAIADSIRAKTGTTDPIKVSAMADAITSIEACSGDSGTKYHITYAGDLPSDAIILSQPTEIYEGGSAAFVFQSDMFTGRTISGCGYQMSVNGETSPPTFFHCLYNPTGDVTVALELFE